MGNEAAKFTEETRARALEIIKEEAIAWEADTLVSGRCHLGGVDEWAEWVAAALGLKMRVFPPSQHVWSAPGGFKERNMKIARYSDVVLVVCATLYPEGYAGMRFNGCYHCGDERPPHIKSGGCWTAKRALVLGRGAIWRFV